MATFITIQGNKKVLDSSIATPTGSADAGGVPELDANGQIPAGFLPGSEQADRESNEVLGGNAFVNVFDDAGTTNVRNAIATAFITKASGFVVESATGGDTVNVRSEGVVSGFTGLIPGDPVFLSPTTPGGITQTPPVAGSGLLWQKVGIADSFTEIRLDIDNDPICL